MLDLLILLLCLIFALFAWWSVAKLKQTVLIVPPGHYLKQTLNKPITQYETGTTGRIVGIHKPDVIIVHWDTGYTYWYRGINLAFRNGVYEL